ncbi:MAG: HAD family hydrolase [Cyanobacteria bacterium SZAS-4]|nr:HAD family hydrolase [Cyanobacteria bacterium SZAS-4]
MPNDQFKGVVFDVDGTLFTSSYTVTERMRETCKKLMQRGIWLSIASARPPKSVRKIGEMIGSRGPLCSLNGSVVLNADGEIVSRFSIENATARNLINQFAEAPGVSLCVYAGDGWFVSKIDRRIEIEGGAVGFEPEIVRDFNSVGLIEKILLMADPDLAPALQADVAKNNTSVIVSRSAPEYVEITASGVDKAKGVEHAARSVGITPAQLVVCGDGENDISMLRNAGHGIAMGHAHESLLRVASQVVGTNNDDSLPVALQSLFNLS